MLLNSPILDIAITLIFIYFLLGLIISSVNEIIMSFIKKRQNLLKIAINELIYDDNWKEVSAKLIESPFIQALKKKNDHFPAYIPARNFAQALLDVLRDNKDITLNALVIRGILTQEGSPIKGGAKKMVLGLLDEAENDLPKFQAALEKFYDDAMDRANGWYKKYIRIWIFFISVTFCVVLNVDTILITESLWQDPNMAKQSADLIQKNVENMQVDSTNNFAIIKRAGSSDTLGYVTNNLTDTLTGNKSNINQQLKNIKVTTATLQELPIPIGWGKGNYPTDCCGWIVKFFGWFITALALMLGSPFWFDLLNKVVNLRAAGKRPLKSAEEPNLTNSTTDK